MLKKLAVILTNTCPKIKPRQKKRMKKFTLIIIWLLAINYCYSQNTLKLDSLLNSYNQKQEFNGNVLISENGKITYNKSFDFLHLSTETPLNDSSIFNLASLTKQFTAACIVMLHREQKINYDDDIRKYLPELAFYPKITIDNLLHHTSGLTDYMVLADDSILQKHPKELINNDKIIGLFQKVKPALLFNPGEKFEYSNTGYLLLASIIERVSKQKFADFLNEKVFHPLNMDNTNVLFRYSENKPIKNLTKGNIKDSTGIWEEAHKENPYLISFDKNYGPGRIFSTTTDLEKWSNALDHNFFSIEEWKYITAPAKNTTDERINYGLGWFINQDIIQGKIIYHTGSWLGYSTFIEKDLDRKRTIIILQNITAENHYSLIEAIRKIVYNEPVVKLNNEYLKTLSGQYKTTSGNVKNIIFENGKLYVPMNETVKLELIPRTKTIFKVADFDPEVNYEFVIENEAVKKLKTYQLNLEKSSEAVKID